MLPAICKAGMVTPSTARTDGPPAANPMSTSAATDSPDNRDYLVANYLAKTVKSETGHAWLINFARLGADKAARVDALTRAAKDAGLTSCPLVAMWQ